MEIRRKDIAIKSGVSESTVSMILNGQGHRYRAETRDKVLQVAEELNYRPHIHARGLRMKRSFLVGLSVFGSNNLHLANLLLGVQRAFEGADYSPLTYCHTSAESEDEGLQRCLRRQVDGLIVNPAYYSGTPGNAAKYLEIIGSGTPVVEVFGRVLTEAPSANVDFFMAGRTATEHLLALGHRRIAMLTHDRYDKSKGADFGPHFDAWHRFQGYQQALADAGAGDGVVITHPISGELDVTGDFFAGGANALGSLLNHPSRPTAVVCYNDYNACGLLRAARDAGVKIPDRLSVIGYGDHEVSGLADPGLTTLKVPAFEVGQQAATTLLRLIDKQSFEDVSLQSSIVVRQSTGAPQ